MPRARSLLLHTASAALAKQACDLLGCTSGRRRRISTWQLCLLWGCVSVGRCFVTGCIWRGVHWADAWYKAVLW